MSTPPSGDDPGRPGAAWGGGSTPPPPAVPPSPSPEGATTYGGQGGHGPPQDYAGQQGYAGYGYAPVREHAPGAVASLVCGILGLFTIPLVLSIIAVVLGNQSKRATAAEPHRYNDQFGQVGRVLGWIGIGLAALGLLFVAAVLLILVPFGGSVLRV